MGAARSAVSPIAARPARSPAEALAARSAPSGLSALSGPGTPLAGRRSPHAGWLRSSRTAASALSGRRLSPRSGWLGSARRPRTVIGSGVGAGGRRRAAPPQLVRRVPVGGMAAAQPSPVAQAQQATAPDGRGRPMIPALPQAAARPVRHRPGVARRPRRAAVVPAGARHPAVQGPCPGEPDQDDRGPRGARHDHRRHRRAAGGQPDVDDRLGEHDAAVPGHERQRQGGPRPARPAAAHVGHDPDARRSGSVRSASPSPAGRGRRTSRSRSRRT